jgi:protoheme ferro-lyase
MKMQHIFKWRSDKVNWPKPTNPEDVRRFLGFVGYYRRFIRQFSHISKPLTDLMPNPTPKKSKKHQQKQWQWGKLHVVLPDPVEY